MSEHKDNNKREVTIPYYTECKVFILDLQSSHRYTFHFLHLRIASNPTIFKMKSNLQLQSKKLNVN